MSALARIGSTLAPCAVERPLLGLCMIVRDEAHGIADTLRSLRDHVDRWTILDTGSTDGTQDLIRQTLGDLPGTLHEEPFVDFATSRNRALVLHGHATTFVIMPDSDDRIVGGAALRDFLAARREGDDPAYLVNLRRGTLSYFLPVVLRATSGWRYRGVVHEYLGPAEGVDFAQVKVPGVALAQENLAQSLEASRRRWSRDLDLLIGELSGRPDDARALFYLAQTYECLGRPEEARQAYERRIAVGGWPEETFEACLRLARLLGELGHPWDAVQQVYLRAHRVDPERAEPLFRIAEHWYARDAHALCYLFALMAAKLPRPDRTLFVEEDVYEWRAADLVAISGYYLGGEARAEGGRRARQCVRVHPGDERIRANWAFYAPPAAEAFPSYRARALDFVPEAPYLAYNPSILRDGDTWRCVVRTSNYRLADGQYLAPGDGVIWTRNFLLDLDDRFEVTRVTEMIDRALVPRSAFAIHGFEDCRLFRYRSRLFATATACDLDLARSSEGPREIALLELAEDASILSATPLRGPWSAHDQKNWMPRVGEDADADPKMLFVYAASPDDGRRATTLELFGDPRDGDARAELSTTGAPLGRGRLRGGSQLVRVPEGWLCVVHDVMWPGGNSRIYVHRFALFSDRMELLALTDPFYFERRGVEFCAGLARDGERLVVSFGVEDCQAWLGFLDLACVRRQLRDDLTI